MSPTCTRQDARRASASSKPYSRNSDNESTPFSQEAIPCVLTASSVVGNPGFPTYHQYKHLEAAYLASLHSRKREKALINQAMLDRIWNVLLQSGTRDESPQFRFWVRKMFTLGEPETYFPGSGVTAEAMRPLLLHDNRPVAIQEQLYEIICYCHGRAQHGGRDKTRAVVREHYSWVPKELISQFVKACPTCILKKSGNPDLIAVVKQQIPNTSQVPRREVISLDIEDGVQCQDNRPGSRGIHSFSEDASGSWPLNGGPLDFANPGLLDNLPGPHMEHPTFIFETNEAGSSLNLESFTGTHPPHFNASPPLLPPVMSQELHSHPMSREVSLYKGLPNGWQYHSEYPEAYEACLRDNDRKVDTTAIAELRRAKRPRVPSVVPLQHANLIVRGQQNKENAPHSGADSFVALPSLKDTLSEGSLLDQDVTMKPIQQGTHGSLPYSLQRLLVFLPVSNRAQVDNRPPYVPQIDPILLQGDTDIDVQRSEVSFHENSQVLDLSSALSAKLDDIGNLEGRTTANLIQVSSKQSARIDISALNPTNLHQAASPFDLSAAPPLTSFQSFPHLWDRKNYDQPRPRDDSSLCPFPPRGPSKSTRSPSPSLPQLSSFFMSSTESGGQAVSTYASSLPVQDHQVKVVVGQAPSTEQGAPLLIVSEDS